jgi:hypothetical protein
MNTGDLLIGGFLSHLLSVENFLLDTHFGFFGAVGKSVEDEPPGFV